MKTPLFLLFIVITISASATIHTVSNIDSSAQFSTIQAACDASNSGDSIYINGSPFQYDNFIIDNKKLAIFGPGWTPFVGTTAVIRPYITHIYGIGASGSELHGLVFLGTIEINNDNINNLIIYRNRLKDIHLYGSLNNCRIEGNWIYESLIGGWDALHTLSHSIIRNNIFFDAPAPGGGVGIHDINGDSLVIDHNLFYGEAPGFPYEFLRGSNLIVTNNVIQLNCGNASSSTFKNNITYNAGNDAPWNGNNNIDAGGNITGKNPLMADEASVDAEVNNPLLNFTIKNGPANNSGSDGLDMGLLFDKGKVTNWNYNRAAQLPYITELNISDQNIKIGGYIHFNGKAKSN